MCGISGFNFEDRALIKKMCDVITHRGPDQGGIYTDKGISLGHRRLSIIDLSEKGTQPMCNENKDIWIVFNGEIYNYKELRSDLENKAHKFRSETDTETIVHAYEEYGEDSVKKLNGDFAFAIYDSRKKKLLLARDRLGIKPLYYYLDGGRIIFASEIKAILQHKIKKEVNLESLSKFITLRYIPPSETIFKNIYKLKPGHLLSYDLKNKTHTISRYWAPDISNGNILPASESFFIKKIQNLFKDCVNRRLMSDVPLGAYLSGGIDSSSVVAMMSMISKEANSKEEVKTFSVGFGYGEEIDELQHAKHISEHFGTNHKEYTVKSDLVKLLPKIAWHSDEPLADPALIPVYLLAQNAKKEVTVVLTGDGGDEVFAGYEQCKFLMLMEKMKKISLIKKTVLPFAVKNSPKFLLNRFFKYASSLGDEGIKRAVNLLRSDGKGSSYLDIVSIFNEEDKKAVLLDDAYKKIKSPNLSRWLDAEYFNNKNNYLNQILAMEMETVLPEDFLMKADKMNMAHAVEERVPFLDHRLVELSFTIPPKLKLNGFNEKYILKKAMADFIPKKIISRQKQRFYVPIDLWIREDLKYWADILLDRETIKRQGYFDYAYIEKIRRNYSKSRLYYARQLWSLLAFQLWHRIFIENEMHSEIDLNKIY